MTPHKPKAMYAASGNTLQQLKKFKYVRAVAYLPVTEGEARRLIDGSVKQTQFCLSFIALW